jgi:hypothetical protein
MSWGWTPFGILYCGIATVVVPLLVTVVIEVVIAAFFRVGPAGLRAVVAVNLVTNPVLSALVFTLYLLEVRYGYAAVSGDILTATPTWPVLGLLEVIIMVAEWRMLAWALRGTAGSSRKLLALAIVMNVVSATLGTFALRSVLGDA